MKDLLKDLEELSETEARLRREGAMMVLEKIRQGSARDDAPPPIPPSPPPDSNKMSVISRKLAGRNGPTLWGEFGALAAQTKGVNLGQGFPNWDPPQFVRDAAVEADHGGVHTSTRAPAGHPSLISLLAARYSMHLDRDVHPESEVAVTVGASQALFVALQALIEEGDEVVLMEAPSSTSTSARSTLRAGRRASSRSSRRRRARGPWTSTSSAPRSRPAPASSSSTRPTTPRARRPPPPPPSPY